MRIRPGRTQSRLVSEFLSRSRPPYICPRRLEERPPETSPTRSRSSANLLTKIRATSNKNRKRNHAERVAAFLASVISYIEAAWNERAFEGICAVVASLRQIDRR